jgi:hypothetical protein
MEAAFSSTKVGGLISQKIAILILKAMYYFYFKFNNYGWDQGGTL